MASQSIQRTRGGIHDGLRGSEYQSKIVQLYSLKAHSKNQKFYCWTEDSNAGKFDDLGFSCEGSDSKIKYSFGQAKQKVDHKILDFRTWFTDGNYHFHKYFESLLEIERNYGDVDLKEILLCTNNKMPMDFDTQLVLSDALIGNFYFEKVEDHEVFGNIAQIYKFDEKRETQNFKLLKEIFLTIEIAKFLFEDKPNLSLLKHCKTFMYNNVIDVGRQKVSFRDNKQKDLFELVIRSGFYQVSRELKSKICSHFWVFFEKRKLNQSKIDEIQNFTDSPDFVEEKIKKFLQKLRIVTNLSDTRITEERNLEIDRYFGESCESNYNNFESNFKDWVLNGSEDPIDFSTIEEIYKKIKIPKISSQLETIKATAFCGDQPVFNGLDKEIDDFMESNSKDANDRILVWSVAAKETFWSCLKVKQKFNSIFYFKTEYEDSNFEKFKIICQSSKEEICLVIECTTNIDRVVEILQNSFKKLLVDHPKVKLLVVCDNAIAQNFANLNIFKGTEILCGNLTKESLENYFEKPIELQGKELKLRDLIDPSLAGPIPLKEVFQFKKMGENPVKPEIYVPRMFFRKIFLKTDILRDVEAGVFKDSVTFDETEYRNLKSQQISVHLIIRTPTKRLQWLKSYPSVENIRFYQDQNELRDFSEAEILNCLEKTNVFMGIAGIGKSTYLQQLAFEMKEKHHNFWIQKIDLKIYLQQLVDFEKNKTDDSELTREFFYRNFLKFEEKLELSIFDNLMREGRVVLLLDGFDEISEAFKDTVITIVSALLELSDKNRFVISTRPEWADLLEIKFSGFPHSFHPFSEENQIDFLLKFWIKDESFKAVAEKVLKISNKYITKKDRSFTGVPLITRLVAEYFEDKLESIRGFHIPNTTELNLFKLLEYFVDKKIKIYLIEKLQIPKNCLDLQAVSNPLKDEHLKLAFQIFFPTNFKKFFPIHREFLKRIVEFRKIGLTEFVNDQLVFLHQTTPEFLLTNFLMEFSDQEIVVDFLFEVVLVIPESNLIRSFLNSIIGKLFNDGCKEIILKMEVEKFREPLHVAARESNTETMIAIMEIRGNLQDFLFSQNSRGFSLFYNYSRFCDLTTQFLDNLKDKFGLDFVKKLLKQQPNPVIGASENGKNLSILVEWIILNFPENPQFIKDLIASEDLRGNSILHLSSENFHKESVLYLLSKLKELDENPVYEGILKNLLLKRNMNHQTFLQYLIPCLSKSREENKRVDELMDTLEWLAKNCNILHEILTNCDIIHRNFLQNFCYHIRKQKFPDDIICLLNFIHQNCSNYREILTEKDEIGENFMNLLVNNDTCGVASTNFVKIFDWMKVKDSNLLYKMLDLKDGDGRNLISNFSFKAHPEYVHDHLHLIFKWFKDSGVPLIDHLKVEDNSGRIFIDGILLVNWCTEETKVKGFKTVLKMIKDFDGKLFLDLMEYLKSNFRAERPVFDDID